jgi:hypothetical protein
VSSIAYSFAVSTSPPQIMPAHTLEHPSLLALLTYWDRLRGNDAMPPRAEARKEISHLLKYVHICDVLDDDEDFRFQLIGDAVFQGLKVNPTGQLVSQHPDMGVRLRFPILMRAAIQAKKPIRGVAIRKTESGDFHAESIWMPFGGAEVKQVMGMTVLTVVNDA